MSQEAKARKATKEGRTSDGLALALAEGEREREGGHSLSLPIGLAARPRPLSSCPDSVGRSVGRPCVRRQRQHVGNGTYFFPLTPPAVAARHGHVVTYIIDSAQARRKTPACLPPSLPSFFPLPAIPSLLRLQLAGESLLAGRTATSLPGAASDPVRPWLRGARRPSIGTNVIGIFRALDP